MAAGGTRAGRGVRFSERSASMLGPALLLAVGLVFLVLSLKLKIGTPREMGPGFLPLALSSILILLSFGMLLRASFAPWDNDVGERDVLRPPRGRLRGMACIVSGVASFVAVLPPFGLLPAVFLSVAVLSQSRAGLTLQQAGLLAFAVTLGAWLIFIKLLGLTITPYSWDV